MTMKDFNLRLSLYLLVFCIGWAFIWSQLLINYGLVLLLLAGISWYLYPINMRHYNFAIKIWSILTLLFLLQFVLFSIQSAYVFIKNVQQIILFVLFYKLCNLQYVKDAYHIILISFVAILSALSWNFEAIMVYPLVATITMIFISLYQLAPYSGKDKLIYFPLLERRHHLFFHTVFIMLISLILIAGIFFMIPRHTSGYFEDIRMIHKEHLTGFSDEISLAALNDLKGNEEVAFRAIIKPSIDESRLYWRGVALDKFDGMKWINTSRINYFKIAAHKAYILQHRGELIEQKIFPVSLASRYLLSLFPFAGLKIDQFFIDIDENDNFISSVQTYTMYSVKYGGFFHSQITGEDKERYLQLPKINNKIVQLNEKIVSSALSDEEKALQITNYLRDNYKYSIGKSPVYLDDPITDFLLFRKEGHCEYFASALCVLLRINRIPCRLVNGYLGGEYNFLGNYYIVRQSRAHSWVEAYLPNKGWILLDATPVNYESLGFTLEAWLNSITDSISFLWENYVLLYSLKKQAAVYSYVENLMSKSIDFINKLKSESYKSKLWGILLVPILLIVVRMIRSDASILDRFKVRFSFDFLFYKMFLLKMRILGYKKPKEMTPIEFCNLLGNSRYQKKAEEITKRYCYLKYSMLNKRQEF